MTWRERLDDWRYAEEVLSRLAAGSRETSGGCWEWTRYRTPDGYGKISVKKQMIAVHQVALYALRGVAAPMGMHVDHLCRNRACCNPWHLDVVTPGENARRGIAGIASQRRNWALTHCKNGHAFSAENTYLRADKSGARWRTCRRCRANRMAKRPVAA